MAFLCMKDVTLPSRLWLGAALCAMDLYDTTPPATVFRQKYTKPKQWVVAKIILLSTSYYLFFKKQARKKQPLRYIEIIAFIVATLGFFVKLSAMSLMKAQYKYSAKLSSNHKLVTQGPYSVVRHPGYSSSLFHALGATMFIRNPPNYMLTIIRLIRFYYLPTKMDKEEENLRSYFGLEYHKYKSTVRYRLIPYFY
eukprot:202334_1